MNNIPPVAAGIRLVETVATIDTIELFARWLPKGARKRIESVTGKRAHIKKCEDETGFVFGHEVIFNRPNMQTVEFASTLVEDSRLGCCWHRDDVAYDFIVEDRDQTTDALMDLLDQYIVLKWRWSEAEKHREEDTTEKKLMKKDRRRAGNQAIKRWRSPTTTYWTYGNTARNLALYMKAPDKVRLEIRFRNAGAVKRAGLNSLDDILNLDPRKLFDHHIKAEMLTERYIRRMMRNVYEHQPDVRRNYRPKVRSIVDLYRSRIPHHVRSICERADVQSLPTKKGLKKVDLEWLRIPDRLTWP